MSIVGSQINAAILQDLIMRLEDRKPWYKDLNFVLEADPHTGCVTKFEKSERLTLGLLIPITVVSIGVGYWMYGAAATINLSEFIVFCVQELGKDSVVAMLQTHATVGAAGAAQLISMISGM
jgi:hypothetical protein